MAVNTMIISLEDWINLPDNPRQRDTVRHAQKAKRNHLADPSPTHQLVSACSIDGDLFCKLDGHTRAYLWETGELAAPKHVIAVVYPVESESDACDLYTHFDNQAATELARDRLFGACRECGINLTSPILRKMNFAVALRLASGQGGVRKQHGTEYTLVPEWRRELVELDNWDIKSMVGPLVGLALSLIATSKKAGELAKIREFFVKYDEDAGVKNGKERDGVQALTEHMEVRRANKTLTGWDNLIDLAERGYTCVNAYLQDRTILHGVRRTSMKSVWEEIIKTKFSRVKL